VARKRIVREYQYDEDGPYRTTNLNGEDEEESDGQTQPDAKPVAEKTWHEISAELFTSFFHRQQDEFLKLRTLLANPSHECLSEHVAICVECRSAVESAEAKRRASLMRQGPA
jgi:hypothetical protein